MDYRKIIFEGVEVGYDHRIDLAGAFVIKVNGKFHRIHGAYTSRPYWINPLNHNKVYLVGNYAEAFEQAREFIK